jgi:integration host factor subunit alpha
MTKADIVEKIYEKVGFSKKESAELVELVFDIVKSTLEQIIKIAAWHFVEADCGRTKQR